MKDESRTERAEEKKIKTTAFEAVIIELAYNGGVQGVPLDKVYKTIEVFKSQYEEDEV